MRKMKVVEVREPKGPLQLVERDVPSPGSGQVLIKVQACGICHSDVFTKEGLWPGLTYPRVPGHEIAGIIDTAGPGVDEWKPGNGSAWDGMADIAAAANLVAEAISSSASAGRCRESAMMVATPNTWLPP